MLKSFLKDTAIYTIPTILSRGIGLFLLPIYIRIASSEELGILDLYLAFGNFVLIVITLEISQAIARDIPECKDHQQKIIYNSSGLYFSLGMYVLFIIFALIFAEELNQLIIGDILYERSFKYALFFFFFNGLFYYLQNILRFELKSISYGVVSLLYSFLNILLLYILGIVYQLGFNAILLAMIFSAAISAAVSLFLLRNFIGFKFNLTIIKKLLTFSTPLVPASLLVVVCLYVDRYMISAFLDIADVGRYGIGVRIASIGGLILTGAHLAIGPIIYKNYSAAESPLELEKIFRYFFIGAMFFFLLISFAAKTILAILTGPEYYLVADIIPILLISLFFSNMYIFMPGIYLKKKSSIIFIINFLAAVINIILNFFLIPIFGIGGAALATSFSSLFHFAAFAYFSQRFYYVPHSWYQFFLVLIYPITIVYIDIAFIAFLDSIYIYGFRFIVIVLFLLLLFVNNLAKPRELIT